MADETTRLPDASAPEVTTDGSSGPTRSPLALLARGTSWQFVGQVVPLVLNLVLTPYIISGLGKPIYGIFLLVNVVQIFMGAFDGGIGPSANRYFTIYAGREDREGTTALLTTLLSIVLGTTVVVFGFFYTITPWLIDTFFYDATRPDPAGAILLLRVMVILVAVAQIRGLFAYVLFAQHRFGLTTVMMLLGHLIYAVGLIITLHQHLGLVGVAWTFVVQQSVATVCIIPSTFRFLTRKGVRILHREEMRDFWGYSWKVQLSSLLDVTAMQSDMMIVGRFAHSDMTPFGVGSNFAQQLRMVPMNAFSPIQAVVGRAVGARGDQGAIDEYHRVQRLWIVGVVGWMCAAAPAAYFAVNQWVMRSVGNGLPGEVAAILIVAHLFYLMSVIQVIWCVAIGRSDLELRYGIVGLVLNLSLTIALIIPFGIIGSISATLAAQVISSVYLSWVIKRQGLGTRSPWRVVPYDAAILCASLSYLGAWGMHELVGGLAGGAGLVVVGLGAAPAFLVYLAVTVGPREVLAIVRRRRG